MQKRSENISQKRLKRNFAKKAKWEKCKIFAKRLFLFAANLRRSQELGARCFTLETRNQKLGDQKLEARNQDLGSLELEAQNQKLRTRSWNQKLEAWNQKLGDQKLEARDQELGSFELEAQNQKLRTRSLELGAGTGNQGLV